MNSVFCRLGQVVGAGVLLVTAGCASLAGAERTISISSDPPGAVVYASGVKVGETPLRIVPDKVFPPRFVGLTYRAYGTLVIKKPGCKAYRRQVNDYVLSKDIHTRLQCNPNYHPAPSTGSAATGSRKPAAAGSVAFRLRRLESLRKDGLITEQEYRSIRRRILQGL